MVRRLSFVLYPLDIDLYLGIHEQTFPNHHETAITHNVTLARHGFIGGSPDIPSTAFSIHALSWFRQLNRVCPRLSDDAFCEALHHHHEVCLSLV